MELYCDTHDALSDVKRSKTKCKQLDKQWDDYKKLVEEKNIDRDYQRILRFILIKGEMYEQHKRERENVIYIDEEEDCDGENDPQYELFLGGLKEHEKSYVLEGENNGVPVYIKYEAESGLEDEWEHESRRKMRSCVEQIDGLSNQKPGLLNDQAAVNQRGSDMQAQSGKNSSTQSPRMLMNLVERENFSGREIELSNQKPGLRTNGLVQNQHGYEVQALSSRKSNVESCRISRTTPDRETLVRAHDGLLSQKSGTRINWVTEDQCEHDDQAQLIKKDKVQSQIKSGKLVKGNHGADIEAVVKIDEEHLYQKPGPRNNWVTENQCEHVDQAQTGEKDKVQNQRKLRKVVRGTNVVKGDHEALKEAVVQIDNEHLYCRFCPRNNRLIGYQCEHADQALTIEKNNVHYQRKKWKVVKGTNFVKEDHDPDKTTVVQIDSAHLYQKPHPRKNWVTENSCKHADQVQPGEKEKAHSLINLQQLVKGKNVVRGDHEANGKVVVQIDSEHLYQKPGQRNNQLTKYQNEHVNQARPVKKYKVQTHGKFKGKNMVKGDNEANRKTMVQIDNENFYQKPGPRNNWVTRDHCERVDQVQSGKKDKVQGQGQLMKVVQGANMVQGDNGLSSQNTAFGKCTAKDQLDHNVKARSGRKGNHSKIRNVKADKCSVAHKKNNDVNNMEKEGDDEIVPDMEILDSAAFLKKGILSCFVPSKKFHKSMEDGDFQHPGSTSVCDGFRKQVLNVLRKPYDKEEYNRHREAVRLGSYLDYHPDLGRKLKRYRYKRGKCLTILRGFFFWLQNLTQEGAFQPWKDRQCLAVEPGSP
ncbi:hypothetical protein Pfo_021233 [Paulownia fortunei]|nr:hypothetical protein Pfo_021233 [Paulownia fortunei]